MINVSRLKFSFPGNFNLNIDELNIAKGEVLGLIGPNGAGKTTLLNIISSFKKNSSGIITVMGEDLSMPKNKIILRRKIAHIFPQPYLLNGSVFDNVFLPLNLRGIRNRNRCREALEFFDIIDLEKRNALALSCGQMQKVVLARAFVTDPELVILDEPFSGIDPAYKQLLIDDLLRAIKLNSTTVIIATQNQFEALSLCDEIAVMINGRIMDKGKPQDIFSRPKSREVADFVGVDTLLEGIIIDKSVNLCFIKAGAVTIEAVSAYKIGDSVFICIRPEDVVISRGELSNSARNHFRATIESIRPYGLCYKVFLNCGFHISSAVTLESIKSLDLKEKEEVVVSFKATAIHLIRRGAVGA